MSVRDGGGGGSVNGAADEGNDLLSVPEMATNFRLVSFLLNNKNTYFIGNFVKM
jgi:hypothetical protein